MTRPRLTWARVGVACGVLLLAGAALVAWLNVSGEDPLTGDASSFVATADQVEHGAYLARAGNCGACHTDRGGAAFAGGKGIATPFGTVYASNLTPDAKTGLGTWSAAQFWRAMHNGRSADGHLLYPVFPYSNFTEITRADSDALYAWLRTQRPVAQPNRPHTLRFPYKLQASLAVWRALFFSPGVYQPVTDRSAQWNRGAYLVRSLGHCAACHSPRNAFGATRDSLELSGGLIPLQNWYAPSLGSGEEAGVADWSSNEVSALLKTGLTTRGATLGPMAEVVFRSTQYLSDADIAAMSEFLQSLPQTPAHRAIAVELDKDVRAHGQALYKDHCAACHGADGEGGAGPGGIVYVPLAGNRKVLLQSPANLIHIVVNGGFPPTTAGNARPYGMPPFGPSLKDEEIAVLASYVRSAWGNAAPSVGALDVLNAR